jgi:hypothetical protein
MKITVETVFPSGALRLSTITDTMKFYIKDYMGYTLSESKMDFREYVKEQEALIIRNQEK